MAGRESSRLSTAAIMSITGLAISPGTAVLPICSMVTFDRFLIVSDLESCLQQVVCHPPQIGNEKCGMRFFGRAEICFHAKMNLNRPALEPGTTARGKVGWFGNFRQPKK